MQIDVFLELLAHQESIRSADSLSSPKAAPTIGLVMAQRNFEEGPVEVQGARRAEGLLRGTCAELRFYVAVSAGHPSPTRGDYLEG